MGDTLKTVQWNVGGGMVRDPSGDVQRLSSYNIDGLDGVVSLLHELSPDLITLQEAHRDDRSNQIEIIARQLGFVHYVSDFYADSHIQPGMRLGQGILSRFPLADHTFQLFHNPRYTAAWEDGSVAVSHDKGVTSCTVVVNDSPITVKTTHLIPFRRFQIDPLSEAAAAVLEDVQRKLGDTASRAIVQGDFNINFASLREAMPQLFADGISEVLQDTPTTPKGRRTDHVLFRGASLLGSKVIDSVLTDHFPVVTTFRIDNS